MSDTLGALREAPRDRYDVERLLGEGGMALLEERLALLHARLGERDEAIRWVEALRNRRPGRFRLIVTNPEFDGLRGDPRFRAWLRQDGLEALLRR